LREEIDKNDVVFIKSHSRHAEEIKGYQPEGEQPHDPPRIK
jgi:hypothetical protein